MSDNNKSIIAYYDILDGTSPAIPVRYCLFPIGIQRINNGVTDRFSKCIKKRRSLQVGEIEDLFQTHLASWQSSG